MKTKNIFSIFAIAFAMLFIVGCGGNSPKDALKNWSDALLDGDIEEANKYSTESTKMLNSMIIMGIKSSDDSKEEFEKDMEALLDGEEEIKGKTATISTSDDSIDFKKVDGKWKVDAKK